MIHIASRQHWSDPEGKQVSDVELVHMMKAYSQNGGIIYVGTDSMYVCKKCTFVAVIAFHDNTQKIAQYFFKKFKEDNLKFADLKCKILEEVNLSVQTAQFVLRKIPDAKIEVHADIGIKQACATKKFYTLIKGWITGLGVKLKIKPDSWASSSIADWHTK